MSFRAFLIGAILTAILQTGALAKIIYDRASLLKNGQEVVLETSFIDPRDLFRGHYVTLNLSIRSIDPEKIAVPDMIARDETLFVELSISTEPFATAKSITLEYPKTASGPVIKGTANRRYIKGKQAKPSLVINFPFDRYFAPKFRAKKLEKLQRGRNLGIILMLDENGNGGIKGITISGEKIYEEPLF